MTGGTIDSVWSGAQDAVVVAQHSILPEYFANLEKSLKFSEEFKFSEVCMKDSRAITDEDRKEILKVIEESKSSKIIITHGTFTMPDTARYIKDNLKRKDQVVILTGATSPIKGFENSDGPLNLNLAISKLGELKPGVYLCMNKEIFTAEEVAKNIAEGKFYSVFQEEQ